MLLSISKEITYLASVYLSISIRFLKAPVNVGFQHLPYLPPAFFLLHLSWQNISSLLWPFALLCLPLGSSLSWILVFFFFLPSEAFLECKISGRLRALLLEDTIMTCSAMCHDGIGLAWLCHDCIGQLTFANAHDAGSMSESWLTELLNLNILWLRNTLLFSLLISITRATPVCGKGDVLNTEADVQVNILTF